MTDILTKTQRSALMAKVKGSGNASSSPASVAPACLPPRLFQPNAKGKHP